MKSLDGHRVSAEKVSIGHGSPSASGLNGTRRPVQEVALRGFRIAVGLPSDGLRFVRLLWSRLTDEDRTGLRARELDAIEPDSAAIGGTRG
jgi:hypothetical protein